MENVTEISSQRSIFVLFLCGVQLVLRSGVFTILDLDKVDHDVMPRFAEVFGSVLSGLFGGSTGGCSWRCCWGAPSLPQLPPATSKNPPPYAHKSVVFCVIAAMGVTSTRSGRGRRKCLKMCMFAFRRQPLTTTSSNRHHLSIKVYLALRGTRACAQFYVVALRAEIDWIKHTWCMWTLMWCVVSMAQISKKSHSAVSFHFCCNDILF